MVILGIETSCDETSVGLVEKGKNSQNARLLSNFVATSLPLHSKTGGIVPEIAAREQLKYIVPVIKQALTDSNLYPPSSKLYHQSSTIYRPQIDAIAVTVGPGLLGSLLVGVETAKTLSYVWEKPIIPTNHLLGHTYANFVRENSKLKTIQFPALALIVSGGHTDLILMNGHGKIKWLGGTRDDAAGEAFDKIGRLLNLPYPGGPSIEKAALNGNPKAFNFPRPMIYSRDFDFSFSGLKAAVLREIKTIKLLDNKTRSDLAASAQQAIIEVLVAKTLKAAQKYNIKSILLGGGVAANQSLRDRFKFEIRSAKSADKIPLFVPEKWLCTDNGAMIAVAASFNYKPLHWSKITANPELYFK
ncbi:MAG: tRNA (adenosine(37)-N6)-threonylcarbamoyltransferase complex transferase subunit TsaD [Candidatus Levybacteria bacterium]|nr:tRNA (adenosine(37)-N6)-threonylcarbamoyltransferase complex transferase subunit TsaD [Candidatus Levybacteria bacterium]